MKTDFGWHIIRLEDRKKGAAQPYDQVKAAIRTVLLREKVAGDGGDCGRLKVEIIDEDLKKYAEEAAQAAKSFRNTAECSSRAAQRRLPPRPPPPSATPSATGKGDLQVPVE